MRFILEDFHSSYDCPAIGSKMLEGRFRDTAQEGDIFVYANISDFNSESLEDADLYVYAHPFQEMCNAEDYDITANLAEGDLRYMQEALKLKFR